MKNKGLSLFLFLLSFTIHFKSFSLLSLQFFSCVDRITLSDFWRKSGCVLSTKWSQINGGFKIIMIFVHKERRTTP